jgi:hypothetical protein
MMKKAAVTFLIILFCSISLYAVPDIVFRTLENKNVYLRDYTGEPRLLKPDAPRYGVVIVFFRTEDVSLNSWFKAVNDLLKDEKSAKRRFFFICVDEDIEKVISFRNSKKPAVPIYTDAFGVATNLLDIPPGTLNNGPGILVYKPDGSVIKKMAPFQSFMINDLQSAITQLP